MTKKIMAKNLDIGFGIKKLRENEKISQEELAEILSISQSKLSKIENGRIKKIDFVLMKKIFDHFGMTEHEIIDNIGKIRT